MLKIDHKSYKTEEDNIALITNKREAENREQMLYDIIDQIDNYNEYVEHCKLMKSKGLDFVQVENKSAIKAKWSKIFASSISIIDKNKVYFKEFRWHLFSYELLKCENNYDARICFDKAIKTDVYMFYQHSDEVYRIENPSLLKSTDFDMDDDVYVFDVKEKWTYIRTHESEFGPYFYSVK